MKKFEFNEEALINFIKENAKFTCLKTGVEVDVVKFRAENPGGHTSVMGDKKAVNMLIIGDDGTVNQVVVIWTAEKGYCEAVPFTSEEKKGFNKTGSYSDEMPEGDCDCPACQLDKALKEEGILPAEKSEKKRNPLAEFLSFLEKVRDRSSATLFETSYKKPGGVWEDYLSQEMLGIEYPNGDREILSHNDNFRGKINLAKTTDKEKAKKIFEETGDIAVVADVAKILSIDIEDYIAAIPEKAELKYYAFSDVSEQLNWFHKY